MTCNLGSLPKPPCRVSSAVEGARHTSPMVQLLVSVPGGRTQTLDIASSSPVAASQILSKLQGHLAHEVDNYVLTFNNLRFECDDLVILRQYGTLPVFGVMLKGGLLGGKGGFGAMLRSMGKGAGSKQTTDFGACRDLYGRRLRHVNDEIRLKKWLEDKEREAEEKDRKRDKRLVAREERTESGIAGWHLAVPTWAEIRPGKQSGYMKQRRKTALCRQWLDARQHRLPPRGAPRWWGCPRGKDCDWAHGEEELRGQGLADLEDHKKKEAERLREASQEAYCGAAGYDVSSVQAAVLEGLKKEQQARKKGKTGPLELHLAEDEEGTGKSRVLPVGYGADTWSVVPAECPWLDVISGQIEVEADGTLRGGLVGEFATAAVVGCTLQAPGCWYYEVEVLAIESLSIQVGWANQFFEADADNGDGVGDDLNSWGYDGVKVKAWTGEAEKDYGRKWVIGDVIGVVLSLSAEGEDKGSYIRYYVNGNDMGEAFTGLKVRVDQDSDSPLLAYYPAVSLECGDSVRVNIGANQPFRFKPTVEAKRFKGLGDCLDMVLPTSTSKPAATPTEEPVAPTPTPASSAPARKSTAEQTKTTPAKADPPSASNGKGKAKQPAKAAEPEPEPPKPKEPKPPVKPEALNLSKIKSQEELEALGLDRLKAALMALQMKCGGTLQERAARLWSVKGLKPDQIDPKLKTSK